MKTKIYPRCLEDMAGVYINTDGIVMPCCWIGNFPHIKEYIKLHGEDPNCVSLHHHTLDHILSSEAYNKIQKSWDSESVFKPCKQFCSAPPAVNENYKQGTNEYLAYDFTEAP